MYKYLKQSIINYTNCAQNFQKLVDVLSVIKRIIIIIKNYNKKIYMFIKFDFILSLHEF